ncbi:MAG: hypothetical protein ACTHJ7_05520 [Candidatus Nitrosocosmicus sp.]
MAIKSNKGHYNPYSAVSNCAVRSLHCVFIVFVKENNSASITLALCSDSPFE